MVSPTVASILRELNRLDMSSSDFQDKLSNVLDEEGCARSVPNCKFDDLEQLVEYLDESLNHLDPSSPIFQRCLRQLGNTCGTRTILPKSHRLPPHTLTVNHLPFAQEGYNDVHEGSLNGSMVCVKRLRVYAQDVQQMATEAFCREAIVRKRLTHPNVAPLLGITVAPFQLISDWAPNGDLLEYIKENPKTDRPRLVSDIAGGLNYLHSCGVVHRALKGSSVQVDATGRAQITDFCLATVATDVGPEPDTPRLRNHTTQWTAPEVLDGGKHTKAADIFSLGMVVIEIFTGTTPFHDTSLHSAMLAIVRGDRPPRPQHPAFTEHLWTLTRRCWDGDPHLRPEASEVLQALLASSVSHPFPWSPIRAWRRLITTTDATSMRERISPVVSTFFDRDEVDVVEHLSGESSSVLLFHEQFPAPTTQYTLLTMPGDYGFLLRDSLNEVPTTEVSLSGNQFLHLPQVGNPKGGSIRDWLARIVRKVFSAIKKKAVRGYARLGKY